MTGILWACAATIILAAALILAKAGAKKTDPVLSGSLSGLVFCIIVFTNCKAEILQTSYSTINYRSWIYLVLAGGAVAAFGVFFFRALKSSETSEVYSVIKCNYVIVFIAGVLIHHYSMVTNDYIVIALMVGGAIVINYGAAGLGMSVLASISAASASILISCSYITISKNVICFICVAIGTVILLLLAIATGGTKKLHNMSFIDGLFIMLTGVAYPAAYIMYNKSYMLAGIYASYIFNIAVLVLMIISSVILKEKISGRKILGALLFIAALFIKL